MAAGTLMWCGWCLLKSMLDYQCAHSGIVFKVVDGRATPSLFDSRPQGIEGFEGMDLVS